MKTTLINNIIKRGNIMKNFDLIKAIVDLDTIDEKDDNLIQVLKTIIESQPEEIFDRIVQVKKDRLKAE